MSILLLVVVLDLSQQQQSLIPKWLLLKVVQLRKFQHMLQLILLQEQDLLLLGRMVLVLQLLQLVLLHQPQVYLRIVLLLLV